jgi:glucose/arabinose dehydrogenase
MTPTTSKEGMDPPVTHWEPSPGISPIMFYTGDKFPRWKNQLFVGAMGHEQLKRLILDNEKVVREDRPGWVHLLGAAERGSAAFLQFAGTDRAARPRSVGGS